MIHGHGRTATAAAAMWRPFAYPGDAIVSIAPDRAAAPGLR